MMMRGGGVQVFRGLGFRKTMYIRGSGWRVRLGFRGLRNTHNYTACGHAGHGIT